MWSSLKGHKIIGAELAAVRKEFGITQVELAKRLRKPQSFVSAYESGQRRLDLLEFSWIALRVAYIAEYLALEQAQRSSKLHSMRDQAKPHPKNVAAIVSKIWKRVFDVLERGTGMELPREAQMSYDDFVKRTLSDRLGKLEGNLAARLLTEKVKKRKRSTTSSKK